MGIVIASLLMVAILLVGFLFLSQGMMNVIDSTTLSGKEAGKIIAERALTAVDIATAAYNQGGGHSEVVLQNTGNVTLGEFSDWDVFEHYRNPNPNNYQQFVRLTYNSTYPPGNNEWAKQGIYLDQAATIPEEYEPGRLNPGEYVKLGLKVSQSIKNSTWVYIKVSTENGVSDNSQYKR